MLLRNRALVRTLGVRNFSAGKSAGGRGWVAELARPRLRTLPSQAEGADSRIGWVMGRTADGCGIECCYGHADEEE